MSALLTIGGGAFLALASMALATYLCRIGGVLLMDHLPPSPALKRALQALPGSIILATVLPRGMKGGLAALGGLAAAIDPLQHKKTSRLGLRWWCIPFGAIGLFSQHRAGSARWGVHPEAAGH